MTIRGNNLSQVKKQNAISIKRAIYRFAPISRSEIAELLSLTPPTITNNVSALIKQGLVQELRPAAVTGETQSVGRKPVLIDFTPNCRYAIGVELGPYETAICLVNLRGKVVGQMLLPPASNDYAKMIAEVSAGILQVMERSPIDRGVILGAVIGVPGFVESGRSVLRTSARKGWVGKNIAEDVTKEIGLPVLIENNARLRAIGEDLFAKGGCPNNFAYYFISKGIACPLIIRNRPYSGGNAGAGEVGHMVMQRGGAACKTCGNYGCLEAIASEQAITDRCADVMRRGIQTALNELCDDIGELSMREVLKAQRMKDSPVCNIMRDAVAYLGIGLANIINFISPELVIVDGYIMKNKQNRDLLIEIVRENLFALNIGDIRIEFVEFDHMRGALGATACAINEFFLNC